MKIGRIFSFLLVLSLGLLFNACGNKQISINAVQPASVPKALNYKKIAVIPFKNDNIGASSLLEQKLMNRTYNGENLFEVVNRSDIKDILTEQSFNNSQIVSEKDKIALGNISGVDALIVGSINNASVSDFYTTKTKTVCRGDKCSERVKVKVPCTNRTTTLNMTIKMVDVSTGDLVISKNFFQKNTQRVCQDSYYSFLNTDTVLYQMSEASINRFINMISPTNYKLSVVVVEDEPLIDLTGKQEDLVERAMNRLDKKDFFGAEKLFKQLNSETDYKSYIASFNLGVIEEAKGNYDNALSYYKHCKILLNDNLSDNPELLDAISRVRILKSNALEASKQVKQNK